MTSKKHTFKIGTNVTLRPCTINWYVKHERDIYGEAKITGYGADNNTYRIKYKNALGSDESYFETKEFKVND